jgi:4-hydroxy-tetrahydrodipicolinate synthase
MFGGAIVAIVTPFRDGKVDEEALRKLIEEQIAAGRTASPPAAQRVSRPPSPMRSMTV